MNPGVERRRQRAIAAIISIALACGLCVLVAAPAEAAPSATVMSKTQRMSGATLNTKQLGWYAKGSKLKLSCHARGMAVKGHYSSSFKGGYDNLWYRTSDGGWVADVDINTGSNSAVVGACKKPSAEFRLPFAKGYRAKITQSPGGSASHKDTYNRHAVDFGVPTGTRIVAAGSGKIYKEGYTNSGAGIYALIDHGNNRCTQYAHLSKTVINRGQSVKRGQTIGYSGSTGKAYGPHLHWNVVNCNSQTSREVPNTAERGKSYPSGLTVTSANG